MKIGKSISKLLIHVDYSMHNSIINEIRYERCIDRKNVQDVAGKVSNICYEVKSYYRDNLQT